jgi:hypothetical protein
MNAKPSPRTETLPLAAKAPVDPALAHSQNQAARAQSFSDPEFRIAMLTTVRH